MGWGAPLRGEPCRKESEGTRWRWRRVVAGTGRRGEYRMNGCGVLSRQSDPQRMKRCRIGGSERVKNARTSEAPQGMNSGSIREEHSALNGKDLRKRSCKKYQRNSMTFQYVLQLHHEAWKQKQIKLMVWFPLGKWSRVKPVHFTIGLLLTKTFGSYAWNGESAGKKVKIRKYSRESGLGAVKADSRWINTQWMQTRWKTGLLPGDPSFYKIIFFWGRMFSFYYSTLNCANGFSTSIKITP